MCVKHIAKFLPDLQQWVPLIVPTMQFGEPILNDSANQARRMRQQRCELPCISCRRCMASANAQPFQQPQETGTVVIRDQPIRGAVILIRIKSAFRNHQRLALLFTAFQQPKFVKIASGPRCQFLKPLILAFVVLPPTHGIGMLIGSFQFDESPGRRTSNNKSDIRSPHTGLAVFRHNRQSGSGSKQGKQVFDKLLESGSECGFRYIRIRAPQFPYATCINLKMRNRTLVHSQELTGRDSVVTRSFLKKSAFY